MWPMVRCADNAPIDPELIKNPKYVVETSKLALISGKRGARHIMPRPKRKKIAWRSRLSARSIGLFKITRSLTRFWLGLSPGQKDRLIGITTIDAP